MNYLCFDVGGTFVKYAVLTDHAAFIEKGKYPTHSEVPDQFFADMATVAKRFPDIAGVGISFPGFVDPATGVAKRAGALGQLDGFDLVAHFKQALGNEALPVAIDNDAKCAALAELLNGNAMDVRNFAVLTLGTGVGCGIVLDGKVLHGGHFRAGEFGMSITDFQAQGYATLHDMAATSSLVRAFAKAKGLPFEQASGEMIMADLQDPVTNKVVRTWAQHVAVAIFNLVATIDPERILIGGGISKNPKILPFIEAALNENPFWGEFHTDLALCKHDNDAGLLGALYIALQNH
ncbi:ROK family protein [Lacticaseibacillus yichunensis]|uniref:ROK family protein n=1 Tax=Lacticaseibacillus yichunensis TaxID=2486015 RepID=A0ABW4CN72_9LACO|nr:ROK family protein [Lacticaseibacillus yichunensis]